MLRRQLLLLPVIFFEQIYDEMLPFSCNERLLVSLFQTVHLKHRLLDRKISSVDKSLIWEIICHKNAFSFEPAVELVSADRDIFGSCKLWHCLHKSREFAAGKKPRFPVFSYSPDLTKLLVFKNFDYLFHQYSPFRFLK